MTVDLVCFDLAFLINLPDRISTPALALPLTSLTLPKTQQQKAKAYPKAATSIQEIFKRN